MIKKIGFIVLLCAYSLHLFATELPEAFVQRVADGVVTSLQHNKGNLSNNPEIAANIIKRQLLPHVYIIGMAKAVLGRNTWDSINTEQQTRFTDELVRMVVRTYAKTLTDYKDEHVKVFPLREGYKGQKRVIIKSQVIRKNAPSIPLDYRLVLLGEQWKIYDMTIEGISLLQNFKTQFAEELARGSFENLLEKMRKHNNK